LFDEQTMVGSPCFCTSLLGQRLAIPQASSLKNVLRCMPILMVCEAASVGGLFSIYQPLRGTLSELPPFWVAYKEPRLINEPDRGSLILAASVGRLFYSAAGIAFG
jgi:hypothetical protein